MLMEEASNTNFYFCSLYFDTIRDWMYHLLHLRQPLCSNGLVQGGNHLIKYNLFLPWYRWKIITRSRKLSSWYSWNIARLALIIITHSTKTGELLANNHLLFKICAMIELEKWNWTRCRAFCWILFIFGILVGHDLSMHIYRFHR
jgi:hypothetical protein